MSVSGYATGDAFTIRIVKYHQNNPDRRWANNYEAVGMAAGTEADLLAFGLVLVAFERQLHWSQVLFAQLSISTWQPDSKPYNPEAFISTPLTGAGARDGSGGGLEPLNVCLNVQRVCAFGRFGHIFYRGALGEGEVDAPAGKAILSNRASNQTQLDTAITASGLSAYLGASAAALQVNLIGKTVGSARAVLGLSIGGVSVVPYNHTWFNRTTAPVV